MIEVHHSIQAENLLNEEEQKNETDYHRHKSHHNEYLPLKTKQYSNNHDQTEKESECIKVQLYRDYNSIRHLYIFCFNLMECLQQDLSHSHVL